MKGASLHCFQEMAGVSDVKYYCLLQVAPFHLPVPLCKHFRASFSGTFVCTVAFFHGWSVVWDTAKRARALSAGERGDLFFVCKYYMCKLYIMQLWSHAFVSSAICGTSYLNTSLDTLFSNWCPTHLHFTVEPNLFSYKSGICSPNVITAKTSNLFCTAIF